MATHQTLTALVHGRAKTGKSLLATSLIKPQLLIDIELGSQFLPILGVRWDPSKPPPKADPSWNTAVVRARDWATVERVMEVLQTGRHPFKAVGVDSLQAAQNRLITQIAGPTGAVEIQQWGEILRQLQNMTEQLRDLTDHPNRPLYEVLVTCPTTRKDDVWGPHLRGQMGSIAPYLFDLTGYLFVEDKFDSALKEIVQVRRLRTRRTKEIEAGERVGGAIPAIYTLPQVTGTPDQVRAKNVTFQYLRSVVYKHVNAGIAAPVASEPPAPKQQPTDLVSVEGTSNA